MNTRHKLGTSPNTSAPFGADSRPPRPPSGRLVHLSGMETMHTTHTAHTAPEALENVLSTSELAAHLRVSVQTLYDLRSQGRGPRGFRVGRELRFRMSEVEAWLERLQQADDDRHRRPDPPR